MKLGGGAQLIGAGAEGEGVGGGGGVLMIGQQNTLHRVRGEVPFQARGVDDVRAQKVDGDCTARGTGFDVGIL